jgi:hypothetical protein
MRILLPLLFLAFACLAQTPFEFAVVKDLVQGSPHVGVISIEILQGTPAAGSTTLRMAARVGLLITPSLHSVYPDSTGLFFGQTLFNMDIDQEPVERVFEVVADECRAFPGMGITHLALDMVSYDDMSWLSMECPVGLADSIARGLRPFDDIWEKCEMSGLEIGTATFALDFTPPVQVDRPVIAGPDTVVTAAPGGAGNAWKSLLLPGWGQAASGRGTWWINLLVEAGGVGLILTEHEREGAAVLGANHILSFFDLL